MQGCQVTDFEDPGDGRAWGARAVKRYLKEELLLHHLFCLADESLLQGVDLLNQLKGAGVTGLSKENGGRRHQFQSSVVCVQ